ncbi:MAG: hypothetical protein ACKO21_07500 [Nodosilinea sp.]|jgi:hypothetical protein
MLQPALPNLSINNYGGQVITPIASPTDGTSPVMLLLSKNYSVACDEEGWVLRISLPMVTDDIIKAVQALYADLKSWLPPRCQLLGLKPVKPEELDRFRDPYGVY